MRQLSSIWRASARAGLAGSVVIATLAGVSSANATPAGAAPARAASAACTWTPHVLPQLPGGAFAVVFGSDGDGRWVGEADTMLSSHAALWQHGHVTDLGRPLGSDSVARDVNRRGVVVGSSLTADPTADNWSHAVMWRTTGDPDGRPASAPAGHAFRLAEPAGTLTSQANGINDAGLIVGWAYIQANGSTSYHPMVWSAATPGRVRDLGTPPNTSTLLNGVSETGLIVGTLTDVFIPGNTATAVAGTLRSGLHPLPSGGLGYVEATAVSGRWISGFAFDPSIGTSSTAVRWENGHGPVVLTGMSAGTTAVNGSGTVAASDFDGGTVWSSGTLTRLSGPLPDSSGGANAITDSGTVGGWSRSRFGPNTEPTLWSCH
jgi:uncharacterized membrane protein